MKTPEEASYEEGMQAFQRGDLDRAGDVFSRFVRQWPRSDLADNALYQLGMVFSLQGRTEDALQCFQECLKHYAGTDAAPLAAREKEKLESRRRGEEAEDAEVVARRLFHEGQDRAARRDFRGAKDSFTRCVEEHPRSSLADNAWLHLSTVHALEGDFAAARKALKTILEDYPGTDAARLVPVALQRLEQDERF